MATNKVKGPILDYNEIGGPTETVLSPDRKDRRRENDDSKHTNKVAMEKQKLAAQRASNEAHMANAQSRNPYSYHNRLTSSGGGERGRFDSLGGYTDSSLTNLRNMPCGGSSNPIEKARPLHLHLRPEKHD